MTSEGLYESASSASPAQAEPEPLTGFLVMCDVSNEYDAWAFGNSVGFQHAITALGGEGQSFDVFSVQGYFDSILQCYSIKNERPAHSLSRS